MKPLIVGQAPSRLSDPNEPLSGRSGRRLAALSDLPFAKFLITFDRVNLIERWPGRKRGKGDLFVLGEEARRRAFYVRSMMAAGQRAVLLGWPVAMAFGYLERAPLFTWLPEAFGHVAICPHPSGVNRWWNEPKNLDAARAFWRALAREA